VAELLDSVSKYSSPEEMGLFFAKRIFKHMFDVAGKQPLGPYVVPLELLVSMGCKRIPGELALAFASWDEVRQHACASRQPAVLPRLSGARPVDRRSTAG
jgi:hypothetical protein